MPDEARLTPANDSAVIDNLSRCVCEAFIAIGQQHPEWLRHDFKDAQWNDEQSDLIKERISEADFTSASDTDALMQQVRKCLDFFLLPAFLETTEFIELAEKIRQIVQDKASHYKEIAILLLDAENLKIDAETEIFLQSICKYPILVKTAFAHWNSGAMRGQDATFHSRNYQLIHVPPGENSADLQMTAHGSSILRFYANAKEVLVCSSDQGLLHLCNVLHTQGLTVYQVSRKGQVLGVLNKQTGETTTWVIPIALDRFILQIKTIIKDETKRSADQWVLLSKVSNIYQRKYNLTLSEAVSNYSNCQSDREFFTNNPYHFALHQLPKKPELYVSLFNRPLPQTARTEKNLNDPNVIDSPAALGGRGGEQVTSANSQVTSENS